MTTAESLARLVQSFFRLHLVERRGVSRHTVRAYRDAIRFFLCFVAARREKDVAELTFEDLHRDTLLEFLADLESTRGNSASTRNARLAAIHAFYRFIATEEPAMMALCQQVLSVPYKRTGIRTATFLDRGEVEHLLSSIDRTGVLGRRDLALFSFLYNTGARAQEVVELRMPAVRLDSPSQVRILGKGRKERLCPLWPETVQLLRDMLRERRIDGSEDSPLFVNAVGRSLTRFGLRHIIRTRVAQAAITMASLRPKKVSPHTFRHTTALHLIQSGVELNVVRSWLGHASIETTHAYVEIDMKMKRAALDANGPPTMPRTPCPWSKPSLLTWLEAL